MVTVCAVLGPRERPRVDAAGVGSFATLHADSLRQAFRAARQGEVDALIVSVDACPEQEVSAVARFIHQFPTISTVAFVSRHGSVVSERLLRLGASGVRIAVDCTDPTGWDHLREVVARPASAAEEQIIKRLRPALVDATEDMRAFLESLARLAPVCRTVRRLTRHLGVCSPTLIARFRRAGLPSPKVYLAGMRRLHAAHLFANPGRPVGVVAARLDYGSASTLAKHLKRALGITPGEFRRRIPFALALERYVELVITPYRETLRTFCPLNAGLWDQGSERRSRFPGGVISPPRPGSPAAPGFPARG